MASVRLNGITKAFGTSTVLSDVSLDVEDGEFLVLVGPSGCGKSTLLRTVAGLEEVDRGQVLIGDRDVTRLAPAKREIAMVFQSYALYPQMTVFENMAFGLRLSGRSREDVSKAVQEVARLLDIEPLLQRRPKALSGGQRQRVAIGRAIVRQPSVFLFDEPLSNLDAALRVRMRYEFAKLHQRLRTTTIYVTHDQVEAMTLASRIAILDKGKVQQVGTAEQLYRTPATQFVAGFIGSPKMNFLDGSLERAEHEGNGVRLRSGTLLMLPRQWDLPSGPVTLGIRAEHLALAAEGIEARVALVEWLGNTRFAYLDTQVADEPLVVQLQSEEQVREGELVHVQIIERHAHLFAPDGQALVLGRSLKAA